MTQTIEQLTARVRELEEEVERTNDAFEQEHKACHDLIEKVIPNINKQLLSAQAEIKRLREDQELLIEAWNYGQFADDFDQPQAKPVRAAIRRFCEALSTPISTEALDAYVAEKVKGSEDAYLKAAEAATLLSFKAEELTEQRDLAIGALGKLRGMAPADDALQAIKESEK